MAGDDEPVTRWLQQAAAGDAAAAERIAAWAYAELETLAARRMRRQLGAREVTLEPAALVNETFLRVLRHPVAFANRRHFFGFVNKVMLRVLIDYQRARRAEKRGADLRVALDGVSPREEPVAIDALALEQALDRLEGLDARKAEVARLRVLWGLSTGEMAEVIGISEQSVRRDWRFVRLWLAEELALPA
jgi:RNA polymerase sigma factor (TIGR02999 family)